MKLQTNAKVTMAAAAGLLSPDVISQFFERVGPALEGFLRLGQIGVAFVTFLYIYKKLKTVGVKPRKRKTK